MKICMHNWMRPEPIETTLKRLKDLGYDGLQIMGEPRKYDWKEVKGLARSIRSGMHGRGQHHACGP